jgi:hypothetical protein
MEIEEKTTVALSWQTRDRYIIVLEKLITGPQTHGICLTFIYLLFII